MSFENTTIKAICPNGHILTKTTRTFIRHGCIIYNHGREQITHTPESVLAKLKEIIDNNNFKGSNYINKHDTPFSLAIRSYFNSYEQAFAELGIYYNRC